VAPRKDEETGAGSGRERALEEEVARLRGELAAREATAPAPAPAAPEHLEVLEEFETAIPTRSSPRRREERLEVVSQTSNDDEPLAATEPSPAALPEGPQQPEVGSVALAPEGEVTRPSTGGSAASRGLASPRSVQDSEASSQVIPADVAAAEARVLAARAAAKAVRIADDSSDSDAPIPPVRRAGPGAALSQHNFHAALQDGYQHRAAERERWLQSLSPGGDAATVVRVGVRSKANLGDGSDVAVPPEATAPLRDRATDVVDELRRWTMHMRAGKGDDCSVSSPHRRWVRQVNMGNATMK